MLHQVNLFLVLTVIPVLMAVSYTHLDVYKRQPIALIGGSACKKPEDYVTIAKTLDKAAKEVGVNFIGGYFFI